MKRLVLNHKRIINITAIFLIPILISLNNYSVSQNNLELYQLVSDTIFKEKSITNKLLEENLNICRRWLFKLRNRDTTPYSINKYLVFIVIDLENIYDTVNIPNYIKVDLEEYQNIAKKEFLQFDTLPYDSTFAMDFPYFEIQYSPIRNNVIVSTLILVDKYYKKGTS